jgi:hypothetical protein
MLHFHITNEFIGVILFWGGGGISTYNSMYVSHD